MDKDKIMKDQLLRLYDQQAMLLCKNQISSKIMLKIVNRQIHSIENYFKNKKNKPICYPFVDKINCKTCPEFDTCKHK